MSKSLTLGSFFDGIGGWLLAAKHAGVKPVWASEIDDFPATVSAHHFPQVKQLGDITKINVDELEPTDIICAGSPCQDLSVAGKREGLAGERSGLFVDAIKLVHGLRARTGKPRYFVWENVPGAFSSNKGHDFAAVLSEITKTEVPMPKDGRWAEAGYVEWGGTSSLAWRTLDAQYWGVPQRRKRIFLVADFGGFTAGEILFVEQGLHGDSAESESTGEETTTDVRASVDSASGILTPWDVQSKRIMPIDGKAPTLQARAEHGGEPGNIFDTRHHAVAEVFPQNAYDKFLQGLPLTTLKACGGSYGGGSESLIADKRLASGKTTAGCINASCGEKQFLNNQEAFSGDYHILTKKAVRRLTPTECERLQGLPDGYTDIEFNGKPAPDSRRYKAIGNGMAQPCADFVIRRIAEVVSNEA